jgi:hypothetical protein
VRRAATVLSSVLAAASWGACSAPTSSSPEFDVTFTVNPDPAVATSSAGVQYKVTNADDTVSYYDYDHRVHFEVNIRENAGLALDITSINLTVQQAAGGIVVTPSGGDQVYFKFSSAAVTNHINANGTADVGFDVWYDLPNQGKEALVTVGFSFEHEDDDDNTYNYSDTAKVKVAP